MKNQIFLLGLLLFLFSCQKPEEIILEDSTMTNSSPVFESNRLTLVQAPSRTDVATIRSHYQHFKQRLEAARGEAVGRSANLTLSEAISEIEGLLNIEYSLADLPFKDFDKSSATFSIPIAEGKLRAC